MEYNIKTGIVEAIQFDGHNKDEILKFINKPGYAEDAFINVHNNLAIKTDSGHLFPEVGHYVIINKYRKIHICSEDEFENMYELKEKSIKCKEAIKELYLKRPVPSCPYQQAIDLAIKALEEKSANEKEKYEGWEIIKLISEGKIKDNQPLTAYLIKHEPIKMIVKGNSLGTRLVNAENNYINYGLGWLFLSKEAVTFTLD